MATLSKLMGNKKNEDISDILRSVFFGEKKNPKKKTTPSQEKPVQPNSDESQIALLRSIAANARISAKNSMALPAILQQTNIMQKNMAKLVRIQGATPTSKADSFFASSKFRENAYEAAYRKGQGDSKTPSQQKKPEGKNLLGLLGVVGGIFKSLFSSDFLIKMIVGSGLILGLSKYFSDPQFKDQVDKLMTNIRKAFISDEGWMKFKQGVADVGKALLLLGGTLVAFKLALAYLSGVMFRMGTGGMIPGVGIPGGGPGGQRRGPGRRGGFGNFMRSPAGIGLAVGATGIAYGMDQMQQWADKPVSTSPQTVPPAAAAYQQVAQSPEQTNASGMPGTGELVQTGFMTYYAVGAAQNVARRGNVLMRAGMQDKILDKWKMIIRKVRTKGFGGYLVHRVQKRLMKSKIGMKIVQKAVTFLVGLLVPGAGWITSLISGAFLLWDILWIVDIVIDVFNEMTKEESDQKSAVAAANSPTPGSNAAAGTDFSGIYEEDKQQSALASAFKNIAESASAAFPWLAPLNAMNLSNLFGNRADIGHSGTPFNFTGSQQQAFDKIYQAAVQAGSPDPRMTASIAMLESGYLKSSMTRRANNPFGQTITPQQIGTNGIVGGTYGADGQLHAKYNTIEDAVAHHVNRWGKRYIAGDNEATTQNLVKGGYNTVNPRWGGAVNSIYESAKVPDAAAAKPPAGRGRAGTAQPPKTPDSNIFGAPIPKPGATGASSPAPISLLRTDSTKLKSVAAPAGPVVIDASQTIYSQAPADTSKGPALATTQTPYNSDWYNLSDRMRKSATGD